jgi:hypothetical protein
MELMLQEAEVIIQGKNLPKIFLWFTLLILRIKKCQREISYYFFATNFLVSGHLQIILLVFNSSEFMYGLLTTGTNKTYISNSKAYWKNLIYINK